ncbi:MAG: SoxR reducing system RseC family protein [Candidatus Cloacimonetes bacterium]|nr:SoxR reducing system RseC family protein [Candidatus Cloacimonadota bacterium]
MTEEHIEDSGIVTAVNGNQVKVEIVRGGGCKSCTMRGFCFSKNTPSEFDLTSNLPLQVGDKVQLNISAGGRIMASLLLFGMPLVFLFGGFLIAAVWLVELGSIAVAFAAMAASFLLLSSLDKKLGKKLNISIERKL